MTPAEQPNAFATGRNPKHAAIAVTAGIKRALGRASSRASSPTRWATSRTATSSSPASPRWWPAPSRRSRTSSSSRCSSAVTTTTRSGSSGPSRRSSWRRSRPTIIQLAVSRQREYVADATGAELLGDPNPLADALETLAPRRRGDPDEGQPGGRARSTSSTRWRPTPAAARRARHRQAVLHPPPDGGARRAPPPRWRAPAACRSRPSGVRMGSRRRSGSWSTRSPRAHKRLIEYVVRQLKAGRSLEAVLEDPYVTNRLAPVDRRALLEEPEVVEAAGETCDGALARHARGARRRSAQQLAKGAVADARRGSRGHAAAGGRVREFFVQNETIILFAQGLVFFSLGFAVWLQRRRATRLTLSSSLIWLAAFAFVEALAVWGYVFVPIQESYMRHRRHRRPRGAARAGPGRRVRLPGAVRPAPDGAVARSWRREPHRALDPASRSGSSAITALAADAPAGARPSGSRPSSALARYTLLLPGRAPVGRRASGASGPSCRRRGHDRHQALRRRGRRRARPSTRSSAASSWRPGRSRPGGIGDADGWFDLTGLPLEVVRGRRRPRALRARGEAARDLRRRGQAAARGPRPRPRHRRGARPLPARPARRDHPVDLRRRAPPGGDRDPLRRPCGALGGARGGRRPERGHRRHPRLHPRPGPAARHARGHRGRASAT